MLNGLLLIDKPILYTSHDVVDEVRRVLGERRVGHAGTLDPMATGLLVIMVGKSTTLFDALSGHDKGYEGVMTLGFSTTTQDAEGTILQSSDPGTVDADAVRKCFGEFVGIIDQAAPLYSAVKVNGRKGYQAARKGQAESFVLPVKKVEIKELQLEAFENPDAFFSCRVSRGTYIRSLVSDMGSRIGVPATLMALRRTSSGFFDLSGAVTLDHLKKLSREEIARHLVSNLDRVAASAHR